MAVIDDQFHFVGLWVHYETLTVAYLAAVVLFIQHRLVVEDGDVVSSLQIPTRLRPARADVGAV